MNATTPNPCASIASCPPAAAHPAVSQPQRLVAGASQSPPASRPASRLLAALRAAPWCGLLLAGAALTALAQSPPADELRPDPDGAVYALAVQPGGQILVGGEFGRLATQTRSGLGRLNADGSLDTSFNPQGTNTVAAAQLLPDGRIVVAGSFTNFGGQTRARIARLLSTGGLDSAFNPGANSNVTCLARQPDGRLVLGGAFTTVAGQERLRLARLLEDGTLDAAFNPAANSNVLCLAMQPDGRILVGGEFTALGGEPRQRIARLNPDGSLDAGFSAAADGPVRVLAVAADGGILLGGTFTTVNGQPRTNLARLHPDGGLDATFMPGVDGGNPTQVSALALQTDGAIVLGGVFTSVAGQARTNLARVRADGSLDAGFDPQPVGGAVLALALQPDGKLLVGGLFHSFGVVYRAFLGRLQALTPALQELRLDGTTLTWLRSGSGPEVWRTTFEVSTNGLDWVMLGEGRRTNGGWVLEGVTVPAEAAVRARGFVAGGHANASGWHVEAYWGRPWILAQPRGCTNNAGKTATFSVVAIGTEPLRFQWLWNGVALQDGGKVSGATNAVLTLTNVLGGDAGGYQVVVSNPWGSVTSAVASLTVKDPVILGQSPSSSSSLRDAGSSFSASVSAAGTPPLQYQWMKDGLPIPGATDMTLSVPYLRAEDAGQYCVVVSNQYGAAANVPWTLSVNLAAPDAGFTPPQMDLAPLAAVQHPDGKILIGGWFGPLSGQSHKRLARLNPDGSLDEEFTAEASSDVYSLAVQPDGRILVGGAFTNLAGVPRIRLGRLHPDGTLDADFAPAAYGAVNIVLPQADGRILVGGSFTILNNGQRRDRIARLHADGSLDMAFNPGANGSIYSMALQPDGQILVGGDFTSIGGQTRNRIARLNPEGVVDPSFNPGADGFVEAIALQADGKILLGGGFHKLAGQYCIAFGRLNPDGSLDAAFNPLGAFTGSWVHSLVNQADGCVLVAGQYSFIGRQGRKNIAQLNPDGSVNPWFYPSVWPNDVLGVTLQADGRVLMGAMPGAGYPGQPFSRWHNTVPGWQHLRYAQPTITWLRGGGAPEAWRTTFEVSTNGTDWTWLGAGTRIPGGWELTGVDLPTNAQIRARAFVTGGYRNASSWFVEAYWPPAPPVILTPDEQFGMRTNGFGFRLLGSGGSTVLVEGSSNLVHWLPLSTNVLPDGPAPFRDPESRILPQRFYRARLLP